MSKKYVVNIGISHMFSKKDQPFNDEWHSYETDTMPDLSDCKTYAYWDNAYDISNLYNGIKNYEDAQITVEVLENDEVIASDFMWESDVFKAVYGTKDNIRTTLSWIVYNTSDSYCNSRRDDTWNGVHIEIDNQDITGTTDYSVIRITDDSKEKCISDFFSQVDDGIFENDKQLSYKLVPDIIFDKMTTDDGREIVIDKRIVDEEDLHKAFDNHYLVFKNKEFYEGEKVGGFFIWKNAWDKYGIFTIYKNVMTIEYDRMFDTVDDAKVFISELN